jgi:hypothetical protein
MILNELLFIGHNNLCRTIKNNLKSTSYKLNSIDLKYINLNIKQSRRLGKLYRPPRPTYEKIVAPALAAVDHPGTPFKPSQSGLLAAVWD